MHKKPNLRTRIDAAWLIFKAFEQELFSIPNNGGYSATLLLAKANGVNMGHKYIVGFILTHFYRILRVFPNSDPLMGFILPAAKREKWWKAPLFAFLAMATFDLISGHLGIWTIITSVTYAAIALSYTFLLKGAKPSLSTYIPAGIAGVIAFDTITGPLMSTFLFSQPLWLSVLGQVPFTLMHIVSASFSILLITPFLDKAVMEEASGLISAAISHMKGWRIEA